jgi:hypothetical protein
MIKLNLPEYKLELKKEKEQYFIRDVIRKKFLLLTPEEWVRQNIITYLINDRGFPSGLISLESGLKVNTLQKRYDALVYSRTGSPLVLIECKAPEVTINQKVFEQIVMYNNTIKAPNMLISNGLNHFFLKISSESGKFVFEKEIPLFNSITE